MENIPTKYLLPHDEQKDKNRTMHKTIFCNNPTSKPRKLMYQYTHMKGGMDFIDTASMNLVRDSYLRKNDEIPV